MLIDIVYVVVVYVGVVLLWLVVVCRCFGVAWSCMLLFVCG